MLKRMLRRIAAAGVLTAAAAIGAGGANAQNAPPPRLAWVVGESAYVGGTLPTSANDATLIAQTLAGEGFEVTESLDLDTPGLAAAYRDFVAKVRAAPPGAAVTVYLAGLGVTVGCDDYLLPIDAQIRSAADAPAISLSMKRVMNDLAQSNAQVRVVSLDGSRPIPPSVSSVAFPKGLIPLTPPPATAFALGAEIHDFESPPQSGDVNDVYAPALASALQQPYFDVDLTLRSARLAAHQAAGGAQTPWHAVGAKIPAFAYLPTATPDQAQQAAAAMPTNAGPLTGMSADAAYWAAIWRNDVGDYRAFLAAYSASAPPAGTARARALLALLSQSNPVCQAGPSQIIAPVPQPVYQGPPIYEGPICPGGFEPDFINGTDYCAPVQVGAPCPFGAEPAVVDGVAFCRIVSTCPPGRHPHWTGNGWACGEPCRWGEMGCPCPPGDPRCHRPPDCRPGMPDCAPIGCPPGLRFVDGSCRPFGCPPGESFRDGACRPGLPGFPVVPGGNTQTCPPGEIRVNNSPCAPVHLNPPPGPTGSACPPGEIRVNNGPCAPVHLNPPAGPNGSACPPGEIRVNNGPCAAPNHPLPPGGANPNGAPCVGGEARNASGVCMPTTVKLPSAPPVVIAPPPVVHAPPPPPPPVVHAPPPPPPVVHAPPPPPLPVVHAPPPPPPVVHAPPPPPPPVVHAPPPPPPVVHAPPPPPPPVVHAPPPPPPPHPAGPGPGGGPQPSHGGQPHCGQPNEPKC